MFSLWLSIEHGPGCDNNELSVTDQLFNLSASHKSILLNQFGGIHNIPLIGVNLISIGHDNIQVIIEANVIYPKLVHVHLDLKEVTHVDSAAS